MSSMLQSPGCEWSWLVWWCSPSGSGVTRAVRHAKLNQNRSPRPSVYRTMGSVVRRSKRPSSDHDRVADYQPVIDRLDVATLLRAIRGNEISTFSHGHFNAYTLDAASDAPNQGATAWGEGLSPEEMFSNACAHGASVIQVNHGMS